MEAAFDDVAASVGGLVEPAGSFTASLAAGELVDAFGDRGLDPSSAEVGPEGAGRVALVRDDVLGSGSGSSRARARDADAADDGFGLGAVFAVAAGEDKGKWPALSVAGEVNLAGQPATEASESAFLEPPLAAVC